MNGRITRRFALQQDELQDDRRIIRRHNECHDDAMITG